MHPTRADTALLKARQEIGADVRQQIADVDEQLARVSEFLPHCLPDYVAQTQALKLDLQGIKRRLQRLLVRCEVRPAIRPRQLIPRLRPAYRRQSQRRRRAHSRASRRCDRDEGEGDHAGAER